jgi:hypothetical protein
MDKFPKIPEIEEEEELPPPPEEPPQLKRTVNEIFVTGEQQGVEEQKSVEPPETKSEEKIVKPKKPPSKKQLEHLERIRKKSNEARAKKVQDRKQKDIKNTEPIIQQPQQELTPPVVKEIPIQPTIINQGISEQRVQELIALQMKANNEQQEKIRQAELIIKQRELDQVNKKMSDADRLKKLLQRRR